MEATITEEQGGSRKSHSYIDNTFAVKQIIEKHSDYEKVFVRVKRDLLWEVMEKR